MGSQRPIALVVEQSAKSVGGHYLEYALRVAAHFQEEFQVTILTSRQLSKDHQISGYAVIPTFTYGYWDSPFRFDKHKKIAFKLRSLKPRIGFRENLYISLLTRTNIFSKFSLFFLFFKAAFIVLMVLPRKIFFLVPKAAKIIGKRARAFYSFRIKVLGRHLYDSQMPNWGKTRKGKKFLKELLNFSKSTGIQPAVIFCGTITATEIWELAKHFAGQVKSPKIIIVVRREPVEENLTKQFWLRLGLVLNSSRFVIFADTETLAQLWREYLGIDVLVLPIPTWTQEQLLTTPKSKTLGVTYLGDARDEKNFDTLLDLLPSVVKTKNGMFAQISSSPSYRVTVELTKNILKTKSGPIIVEDHSLKSDAYREAIFSSEIVYVNYDSLTYSHRSSGIFVEALMADKPVIVSDGSWMHYELYKLSHQIWKDLDFTLIQPLDLSAILFQLKNSLIRYNSNAFEKISFNFKLNTGIVLVATSWTDIHGCGYLVVPEILSSEKFVSLRAINPNLEISNINLAHFQEGAVKFVGGVVASSGRANLALDRFLENLDKYHFGSQPKMQEFKSFHSATNMRSTLLQEVQE